jgi:predicted amidohydrolase YtcJ
VVNSKAFEIAGITKDTPDPPGGEFKRDRQSGQLTGLLFERPAQNMIRKFIPKTNHSEVIEGIKLAMKEYNSYGIVGVSEPGVYVGPSSYRPYYELWSKGELTVRVRLLLRATKPEQIENFSTHLYQGFGDDLLKISGIKMLLDGGVETAYLKEPYQIVHGEQEKENYHGVQVLSTEALTACCQQAAKFGWHLETHAVGDAAIELLVNTYDKVNQEIPIKDLRWAVMHIFLPTQQSIDKMKEIGISATVQDHPTYLGANQVKYWGEKRGGYAIPNRKLLDEGIMLGGGSDAPVVNYDPFLSLWWMVTRNTVTAGILGADQKITREEAIQLYTINNAYFTFEEKTRGSIEPGKLADLVILDKDILKCPADDIKNIRPLKTMMGGKFVFESN